ADTHERLLPLGVAADGGGVQLRVELHRLQGGRAAVGQADEADLGQRIFTVGHQNLAGERINVFQPHAAARRNDGFGLGDVVDRSTDQFEIFGAVVVQNPELVASGYYHV